MKHLTNQLKHKMEKECTRYRCVVLVNIYVACSLYKLAHGYEYLQCNELFVVGKSTIHLVLWEFVHVVNDVFKNQIQ
jgi:hypothetical protein